MLIKTFIDFILLQRLNVWRDTEREIITLRMQMQLLVRQLVSDFGPSTRDTFMSEIERCIPSVLVNADSRRLKRRLGEMIKR